MNKILTRQLKKLRLICGGSTNLGLSKKITVSPSLSCVPVPNTVGPGGGADK